MLLVFLDESGSLYPSHASWQRHVQSGNATGPAFFVMAAVGVQECHQAVVDDWFARVKQAFLGAGPLDAGCEYEIKGSLLYALRLGKQPKEWHGQGRQRRFTPAQKAVWQTLDAKRLDMLERAVFDLFRRLAPTVWVVVVKQASLYQKYGPKTWPPHHWGLTFLQQRAAQHVQAQHGVYQQALFIVDQTSTLGTAPQFDDFLKVRTTINGTASWPVEFSRYLVNVPVSGQSHLVQAIQLADFVAHAAFRYVRGADPLGWFAKIEPLLAKHWTNGKIANAGLTFIR